MSSTSPKQTAHFLWLILHLHLWVASCSYSNLRLGTTHKMSVPWIIYGTAWKKDLTAELVYQAVQNGFRAIDTACQPKHYNEAGVGVALHNLYSSGIVTREDIFIQTKFTSVHGQDPTNIPYDIDAPLASQVRQSFSRSLYNLNTHYIDSLLLHSPMPRFEETMEVWSVFESLHDEQRVKALGISNIYDLPTLERLYNSARVKPSYIQNRFYSKTHYDREIRDFCNNHGIVYQSFWSLTANKNILHSDAVHRVATKHSKTPAQVFFRFLMQLNIHPLSGTKSELHMNQDIEVANQVLDSENGWLLSDSEIAGIIDQMEI